MTELKPGMDLVFRESSIKDHEQLKALGILAYAEFMEKLTPGNRLKLSRSLNDDAKRLELINISRIFVCCDGNKIVGMAYFIPKGHPFFVFLPEWSYLRMVGVDPNYRGRGIARKLTEKCIAYARETKEKTIALHTSEFMDAARHIYESLGFKKLRELDRHLGIKYWLYTLEL